TLVAYPSGKELAIAEVLDGDVERPVMYHFGLSKPTETFCMDNDEVVSQLVLAIGLFGVTGVHIHHLLSWPVSLGPVLRKLGIKTVYSWQGYYCVWPRWNLFDHRTGASCACDWSGSGSGCLAAMVEKSGATTALDFATLRRKHRSVFWDFLGQVDACIFP